jgi:hypothetical protein
VDEIVVIANDKDRIVRLVPGSDGWVTLEKISMRNVERGDQAKVVKIALAEGEALDLAQALSIHQGEEGGDDATAD